MENIIKLYYGDGWSGRHYIMKINDKYIPLIDASAGGPREENKAREKAANILKAQNIDYPIEKLSFEWDGTM